MKADCRLCLGEHDPEIHRATESLHGWLRDRVRRALQPVEIGKRGTKTFGGGSKTIGMVPVEMETREGGRV